MRKAYHIDWLSITLPYTDEPQESIPLIPGMDWKRDIRPLGYYNRSYEMECGGTVRWHTEVPTQGVAVQFTGQALGELFGTGKLGNRDVVQAFYGRKGKVSRLDFAFDGIGIDGKVQDLRDAIESGKVRTRTRKMATFSQSDIKTDENIGDTLYIGSRLSDKFVRVYDKAKEMNLLEEAWLRVEIQTRGRIADTLFTDMAEREKGYACSDVAARWTRAFCDFPDCQWWNELMFTDWQDGEISKVPRKTTDFNVWLEQARKIIANHMETHKTQIEAFLGDIALLFAQE